MKAEPSPLSPEDEALLAKIRVAVEREGGTFFDEREVAKLREIIHTYEAFQGFGVVGKWALNVMKWLLAFIAAAAAIKLGFEEYIQGILK